MAEGTPQAYPLTWPAGFPRTKSREAGKFKTSLAAALANVELSLRLFGRDSGRPLSGLVMSSNVTLGASRPSDPGVAVWFLWEGMTVCIPVDRYTTVEANLQAIHHVVEARRVELRHGTLAIVRASFAGFRALPAPNWRRTLGDEGLRTLAEAEAQYKRRAHEAHPDKGGAAEEMARLNAAIAEARREFADG